MNLCAYRLYFPGFEPKPSLMRIKPTFTKRRRDHLADPPRIHTDGGNQSHHKKQHADSWYLIQNWRVDSTWIAYWKWKIEKICVDFPNMETCWRKTTYFALLMGPRPMTSGQVPFHNIHLLQIVVVAKNECASLIVWLTSPSPWSDKKLALIRGFQTN